MAFKKLYEKVLSICVILDVVFIENADQFEVKSDFIRNSFAKLRQKWANIAGQLSISNTKLYSFQIQRL